MKPRHLVAIIVVSTNSALVACDSRDQFVGAFAGSIHQSTVCDNPVDVSKTGPGTPMDFNGEISINRNTRGTGAELKGVVIDFNARCFPNARVDGRRLIIDRFGCADGEAEMEGELTLNDKGLLQGTVTRFQTKPELLVFKCRNIWNMTLARVR